MGPGRIRLTLITNPDGTVTGSYFMPPSLSDIKVEGRMIDPQSLSLREVRDDATQDGSIYLKKLRRQILTDCPAPGPRTTANLHSQLRSNSKTRCPAFLPRTAATP